MIYLKKDNEIQTAFIPKNGSYEGKLSYKEGYEVGKAEGIAEGKNNPYSTKGFFFENGEKEYIYPVKIDRNTLLQISLLGGNTSDYAEISFYPMGDGCVLANKNDSNIVCAMRGDLLRVFIYNNLQFELPCKQEEWHTLRLYTDRVILDGEETYFNTPYMDSSYICACVNRGGNGFYRGLIQYIKGVEGEAVMYYISNLDEGGFKRLRSDNGVSDWYENNFVPNWGEFPIMQAKAPLNSVFINVEGGNVCPELTVLDVDSNGRYEGAYNIVNVNVPDVNGSYDEGYNNGYNDGKAEGGGSCNIEETRWAEPTPADVDGSGYLVYHKSEGYDGMDRVALNMNGYNALKYNEGYNDGKAEGGDCPELTELNVTENGTYEGAYNKVNVDVPQEGGSCNLEETRWGNPLPFDVNESYLIIQPSMGYDGMKKVALNMDDYNAEKYNEGYEAGKAEGGGGNCNLQDKWVGYNSPDELTDSIYVDVYPDEGYDGMGRVVADVRGLMQYKYDEGYNFAINNDAVLIPARIEKVYNTIALRTENLFDSDIIKDRTLLVGSGDEYTENGFISYTQNKCGIVISGTDEVGAKYVTKIRKDALNWNTIEYFYSYTIVNFGVDMTRDMSSNVRHLYIKYNGGVGTGVDSDIYFRTGCFATSNLLNKIVFYEPYYINVEENAFEGISSSGEVVVVGEDNAENRAKYDTLMAQLGDGWTLTFVDEYNE